MTPCNEWQGKPTAEGYGRPLVNGRRQYAHRVAYERAHGPIPSDLCVLHRCDNRLCIEPTHLFLGTRTDNSQDMKQKGRAVAPNKRFTNVQIQSIRARLAEGDSAHAIAREFHVDPSTISHIRRGVTYGGLS